MEREKKIDALLAGLQPLPPREKARVAHIRQEGWRAKRCRGRARG